MNKNYRNLARQSSMETFNSLIAISLHDYESITMNKNLKSLLQHIANVDNILEENSRLSFHIDFCILYDDISATEMYYPQINATFTKVDKIPNNFITRNKILINNIKSLSHHYMKYFNLPKTDIIIQCNGDVYRIIGMFHNMYTTKLIFKLQNISYVSDRVVFKYLI